MTTYTAFFRTDAQFATRDFDADTPEDALAQARAFHAEHSERLWFEAYDEMPVNEIAIVAPEGSEDAVWLGDDMRLRLAAGDMLDALALCEDALSGLARLDDGTCSVSALHAARAAIAKAKGGAS